MSNSAGQGGARIQPYGAATPVASGQPPVATSGGGGKGGAQPPNIMQTSAGAYQGAVGGTAAGMQYRPMMVGAPGTGPTTYGSTGSGSAQVAGGARVNAPGGYQAAQVNTPTGYEAMTVADPGGYQAAQVTTPDAVQAQNVAAGQLARTSLDPYMNPYESQVVQQSLDDLNRSRQMQANQLAAQATSAGAFGGSRQALMESELNRNFMDQSARTASQLRLGGFQNAQQQAQQDIASRMQADLANQGANLQAGQFNAGLGMQAGLANQSATNQASQFGLGQTMQANLANQSAAARAAEFGQSIGLQAGGMNQAAQNAASQFGLGQQMQAGLANQSSTNQMNQLRAQLEQQSMMQRDNQSLQAQLANQQAGLAGAQLRLGGASQLGNLSNLGFGMGQNIQNQMMQQGNMQQMLNQQLINSAQQQYGGYQQAPAQSLALLSQALGATPTPQTTTTSKQPGLFDYLTLGANTYGAVKSDARLKADVTPVGYANGHRLYRWRWRDDENAHLPTVGVLAQEVMRSRPDAVALGADGYLRVHYGRLLAA